MCVLQVYRYYYWYKKRESQCCVSYIHTTPIVILPLAGVKTWLVLLIPLIPDTGNVFWLPDIGTRISSGYSQWQGYSYWHDFLNIASPLVDNWSIWKIKLIETNLFISHLHLYFPIFHLLLIDSLTYIL